MLPAYLLSLREGLEAALIIGIVFGALRKFRRPDLDAALWLGVSAAIVTSVLTALVLTSIGFELKDPAEAIFEGITMLIAAGILTWMIFWMSKQSRNLRSKIEDGVGKAVATTGKTALFWLAFIAVVREGIELALFLTAALFAGDMGNVSATGVQTLSGALLGLGTAALLGWSLFASSVRLDLRKFFQITGFLLILFAAGLAAHSVHEFNEMGFIPGLIAPLWNLSAAIPGDSLFGQVLTSLFGYNPAPSLSEVLTYTGYLVLIFISLHLTNKLAIKKDSNAQAQA
jgi:high-affinity iron transporter